MWLKNNNFAICADIFYSNDIFSNKWNSNYIDNWLNDFRISCMCNNIVIII